MELSKKEDKIRFVVAADDKVALERAISYVNLQSCSDYELVHFESHEVGLGTLEVSKDKVDLEFMFMMGVRYRILCKKIDLDFS